MQRHIRPSISGNCPSLPTFQSSITFAGCKGGSASRFFPWHYSSLQQATAAAVQDQVEAGRAKNAMRATSHGRQTALEAHSLHSSGDQQAETFLLKLGDKSLRDAGQCFAVCLGGPSSSVRKATIGLRGMILYPKPHAAFWASCLARMNRPYRNLTCLPEVK